jgi:hypothetical protein
LCRTGNFNLSYQSLTSYEAREILRNLKTTDLVMWDELTKKSLVHSELSESVDTELEHKEFTETMFGDDSDLPCDAIMANFLRSELDGVKANDDGDLSSATMAQLINNDKLELANANTFGTNSELELGCGKRKRTANKLYNTKSFW